jgi:2,3,4,5-tetrahydropyridine-2,6-dicarboxylate N-succinyltransferase
MGRYYGGAVNATSPAPHTAAFAAGLATLDEDGRVLDVWYPSPTLTATPRADTGSRLVDSAEAEELFGVDVSGARGPDERRGVERVAIATSIEALADPPVDTYDVYLRLHLLSHRLVQPNGANLDGIFGLLNNVVWTNLGPCPVEGFEQRRLRLRAAGEQVVVFGLDKFPRMTDYVIPSGVRIADADRVRLGAHLAEGTTVMHEGHVNFNAGTLGTAMVEGRITASVVVGDGTDLGGGSSIMGTLSGGGKEVVRIGERCLIGANGGVGISLGDDCVVEAGLYVTAGTRVTLPDGAVVKAVEVGGQNNLLFRRHSETGRVEVVPRSGQTVELNTALHAN